MTTVVTPDDLIAVDPIPGPGDPAPDASGLRGLLRSSARWGELRRTPYGILPIVLLAVTGFFQTIDSAVFNAAGPEFVRRYGISIGGIIGIQQTVGVLTAVAALGVGFYADRHRRVPILAIGTCISGLTGFLSGFGRRTFTLGAPRVADDVANKAADVPYYSLIADYYPVHTRGRVFALSATLNRIGLLAALPVGAGLVIAFGLGTTFLILGVPIFVMGILLLVLLKEPVRGLFEREAAGADAEVAMIEDEPLSFGEAWRATFAVRTLRRLFAADIIGDIALGPLGLFFTFFLSEKYGLSFGQRALVTLPSVVAGLLGGYLGGGLVDVFSRKSPVRVLQVYGVFGILGVIPLFVYLVEPPLWGLIAAGVVFGFAGALIGPAINAIYSTIIPPNVRTQGLTIIGLSTLGGSLIGLPLLSAMRHSFGYPGVFAIVIPFALVSAIVRLSAAPLFELDRRAVIAATVAAEDWRAAKRAGSTKLLVCRDVDVEYNGVQVLFGLDFEVDEGDIIALLGTNGAGKSTLLRAISGTQEASSGAIVFDGRDITHSPPNETARRRVVHMPGGRGVFPGLTVRDNLLLGNWMSDDAADGRARMTEVLEMFPILRERADAVASALSGGEQQMLSLAQAFLGRPKLLMIDELSLGLSPAVVGQLVEIVKEIHRRGTTVIVVEQSVNVALSIAERAVFMEKGEIKFDGATTELLRRPDILRAVYVKGSGALTDRPGSSGERMRRLLELGDARPVLEVGGAVKRFGGITAVDHVDLALRDGEVLGIIGPNGSGKTTLFELISGYQKLDEGFIRYEGIDVTGMGPEERARRKLVRRFQDARLFPSLTVFETLLVALEQRHEAKSTLLAAGGLPQARRAERRLRARAERLVELLELGAYRDKFVKELSTGLRRIVDLACVLALEPRVLLLDEPSSGIAQAEAEGLAPLLRRVRFETGCSILIIEHDIPLISAVSDELVALESGAVVVRGLPEVVLNDERVIESYLGTSEAAVKRSGGLA
ncbi:MAG: hypothetical protein NVS3B12_00730 [Acidimicrobiales bacterium]